jgi:hypothetical protein
MATAGCTQHVGCETGPEARLEIDFEQTEKVAEKDGELFIEGVRFVEYG